MTRTLLTVPPNLCAFLSRQTDHKPSWLGRMAESSGEPPFIGTDPRGQRLGSGGGTVHVLHQAWKASETRTPLAPWISQAQTLILHAGGESRRLPSYAAVGKAFIPLPWIDGLQPSLPDQLLADFQLPSYRQTLVEAGKGAAALVTSGDVWLDFDATDIPEVRADIAGVGMKVSPEVAQHFGVYFVARDARASQGERPIVFFRQKPSPAEIAREAAQYDFFVDTGMWLLSAKALEVLFRRCGWNSRSGKFTTKSGFPDYLDLYTEVGIALGAQGRPDARLAKAGFGGLTTSVVPLPTARFYHLGSSRQLLESMEQLQWRTLTPQRSFRIAVDAPLSAKRDRGSSWMEASSGREPLDLDGANVVTGLPGGTSVRRLLAEQCLDITPVGPSEYAFRPYHIDDSLRGVLRSGFICGQPAGDWIRQRSWTGDTDDVFKISIYPVLSASEITDDLVQWFFSTNPDPQISERLRAKRRLSAAEIPNQVNFERYFAQRSKNAAAAFRAEFEHLQKGRTSAIFDSDFSAIAEFCHRAAPELKRWLLANADSLSRAIDRPEHHARFLMLLSELTRGAAQSKWKQASFQRLQNALVSNQQLEKASPRLDVKEDQIVWARSPVRLDLAGGWTDTPPFCLEAGGSVLNLAVLLNGQPPIQVFVRPTREPLIRLRSIDLGSSEEIRDFNGLADFRNPRGHFSLPKAALALAGFLPQFFSGTPYRNLAAQLKAFGSGLEISLLSAVPKGSGLGTSSILAATLLGGINRACALSWDEVDLYNRVLGVEQLLTTGGGWQDQAGALFPGIKLIQTQPGLSQVPTVRYLPSRVLDGSTVNRSFLLYYSGATRMAKGILQEIVRDMFLANATTRRTLGSIHANAEKAFHAIQRGQLPELRRAIARSWRLNQQLDSGTTTPEIEKIIRACGDDLAACKLLGAGGGGYMLICAKDAAAGDRIRLRLEAAPPNPRARFIDFAVAERGLQVTVS